MNRRFNDWCEVKAVRWFCITILALCAVGVARAQTAWDTNTVSWTAPTTCTSGQPVANCAVTGYRVERSATSTGTFAAVGTSTTTSFTHTSAVAGQNCYRVIALSAKGDSAPSNVACKANTQPSGPPNPPTNLVVVEQTAWNIQMKGHDVVLAQVIGKARLGAVCGKQCFDGYCPVARSNIRLSTNQPSGAVMVAKCG